MVVTIRRGKIIVCLAPLRLAGMLPLIVIPDVLKMVSETPK
jgi:type II secretory pathway component PulL